MKYTDAAGIERQTFDGANWKVLDKFVEREVFMDVTLFVETIMQCHRKPKEEFPEFYEPEYNEMNFPAIGKYFQGGTAAELDEFIEELETEWKEFDIDTAEDAEKEKAFCSALHESKAERRARREKPEIPCFFAVSERLADDLKRYGYRLCEYGLYYIWGRETFGQAISCDTVISKICIDMEIMEGQKYSWIDKHGNVM